MTYAFLTLLQAVSDTTGVPLAGVRISVWFIGMFLLALGGALVYLRIQELGAGRKTRRRD